MVLTKERTLKMSGLTKHIGLEMAQLESPKKDTKDCLTPKTET